MQVTIETQTGRKAIATAKPAKQKMRTTIVFMKFSINGQVQSSGIAPAKLFGDPTIASLPEAG
jgi:hypothetical protein